MFIGHLGAGLALKKLDPKINVGWYLIAVLFLDILLWIFILADFEVVSVPTNYPDIHYLFFQFPYSHSLVASLLWSILLLLVTRGVLKSTRTAWIIALGVFSHFILDVIAHPPQIPLLGSDAIKVGLSLWTILPVELSLELALLMGGLYMYLSSTQAIQSMGKYGMLIFMALLAAMAFTGQMMGPPPESANQIAVSSLGMILFLVVIATYLDRKRITKTV